MSVPVHEQIAEALRSAIRTGDLAVGAPLPSEAQLCERWRTSRAPVRQALAALRSEGLVGGGPGRPPVVRRATLVQPFDTFLSFSRWAHLIGAEPGQRTLECALRPAPAQVADAMGLEPGDRVVQLLRLRSVDGVPAMVERSTFTAAVGRVLFDRDLDAGSVYSYLVADGLRVGPARHVIDAVGADEQDAELLSTPVGAPLLRERRTACTEDGTVFEHSDDRYRPDRVVFTIDNSPDGYPAPGRTWGAAAPAAPGPGRGDRA